MIIFQKQAMEKVGKETAKGAVNFKLCYCNLLLLEDYEVACSSTALTKLKVLNKSWVTIEVDKQEFGSLNGKIAQRKKDDQESVLQLVSFEDLLLRDVVSSNVVSELSADFVYLRTEAAFNLCKGNIHCFQSFLKGDGPPAIIKLLNTTSVSPPIVTKATISVVRSPDVPLENEYDIYLQKHFQQKRHLNTNQIFKVDCNDYHRLDLDQNQTNHLWFKVISMESQEQTLQSGWVQNDVTMLYAKDSVNCFVPSTRIMNSVKDGRSDMKDQANTSINSLTRGLGKYLWKISEIARPVIQKSIPPDDATLLLHGPSAVGKRLLMCYFSELNCMHLYEVNCFNVIGESIAAVEQRIEAIFNKAIYCSPCVLLLRNIHALSKDREGDEEEPRLIQCISRCVSNLMTSGAIVVVVATTNVYNDLSTGLCRLFMYEVEFEVPDEESRLETLIGLTEGLDMSHGCLSSVAKKTAGMVLGDLRMLVSKALDISRIRAMNIEPDSQQILAQTDGHLPAIKDTKVPSQADIDPLLETENNKKPAIETLNQTDIDHALDLIHTEYKDTLGMPKIPDVSWKDVGGLADVKSEIIDTIKIPLLYPELTSRGLRRSGLLLYGPPGCGKTLLAKAVATEFSLNFFSVKGPELINMYVGQSEQNVRDMFQKARECSPCVVFFDELDSIAPNRGKSGDSGGVMDRVVSQLLAELDGMQTSNELFVIGATNRPDLLDNALLRPGRFDKLVYVGFPETKSDRINIIKSYTNKMNLNQNVDLDSIEDSLPLYLTGADFYALCSDAVLNAIRRSIMQRESLGVSGDEDLVVMMDDFKTAGEDLVPSISIDDVLKYKDIKRRIDSEKTKSQKK